MADFKTSSWEHGASSSSEYNTSECSNEDMMSLIGDVISEKMVQEEKLLEKDAIEAENELQKQMKAQEKVMEEEQCYKRLNLLLSRSSIYAQFMAEKLKRDELKEVRKQLRAKKQTELAKTQGKKRKKAFTNTSNKKSVLAVVSANQNDKNEELCNSDLSDNKSEGQPSLLTGAVMHPYQIDGFEWLKVLFENGVNGILADEMGLGKTIQTIAFIAYLIEMGISGPFLVCAPLSTVPNWHSEFRRFAPSIPVMVYHGTKQERSVMRYKLLKKVKNEDVCCYPVAITSYQIALSDYKALSKFEWTLLVIDEAQRIKNFQCKLVVALKSLSTSHRLLLTGTPLQNNLSELWSLLNFILPEIFDDLKVFESWFDITRITEKGTDEIVAKEQEKQIISKIHQILSPFLLRRTKAEVKLWLPQKKELVVHAPLTKLQKEYYTSVLNKTIEKVIHNNSTGHYFDVKIMDRKSRSKVVSYDHIYKAFESEEFEDVSADAKNSCVSVNSNPEIENIFADIHLNVRNTCMLLRRICCHPYLVSFPLDDFRTGERRIDEDLISNSGKLLVLDAMLPELKKRGHKILLFSQFVAMLNILEEYCMYRNYNYNLLCGDMSLEEREKEITHFNESKESFIFLISTKAGGLGLNLAAADTVILYDSDWNPQGDLQAQDRCHRIGQHKPVIVYRLIIPNTVDERMFERANAKRKLEKVIIKKGRFNSKDMKVNDKLSIEELLELLQSSDCSGFVKTDDNCVLSPEELNRILDRSTMIDNA